MPAARRAVESPRQRSEVDRGAVAAADEHADALAGLGHVRAREQRREGGGATGFGPDRQRVEEAFLRAADSVVGDQDDALDVALRVREHQLADAARREGVGGDAVGRRVDRDPGRERARERRCAFRLDADDAHAPRVPGCDPTDQPAAADRDEQRVDLRQLPLDLRAERRLSQQRLALVEGVHGQRARLSDIGLARRQRVGVALAGDDQVGAVGADARRASPGAKWTARRWLPGAESHRRVGDGGAVIPARGGDDARRRDGAREQVGERAARLERARVLEQLELGPQPEIAQTELRRIERQDRGLADVGPDQLGGREDLVPLDWGDAREEAVARHQD